MKKALLFALSTAMILSAIAGCSKKEAAQVQQQEELIEGVEQSEDIEIEYMEPEAIPVNPMVNIGDKEYELEFSVAGAGIKDNTDKTDAGNSEKADIEDIELSGDSLISLFVEAFNKYEGKHPKKEYISLTSLCPDGYKLPNDYKEQYLEWRESYIPPETENTLSNEALLDLFLEAYNEYKEEKLTESTKIKYECIYLEENCPDGKELPYGYEDRYIAWREKHVGSLVGSSENTSGESGNTSSGNTSGGEAIVSNASDSSSGSSNGDNASAGNTSGGNSSGNNGNTDYDEPGLYSPEEAASLIRPSLSEEQKQKDVELSKQGNYHNITAHGG